MKRLAVKLWEYTNKNWETKWNYTNFGRIVNTENGEAIVLETTITNFLKQIFGKEWSWWVNIYESDQNNQNQTNSKDENLPF